jgi:hypothetical protein
MDNPERWASVVIFGVAWAFVLCLFAMMINFFRWLDDKPQYQLKIGHFLATWLILWSSHSLYLLFGR